MSATETNRIFYPIKQEEGQEATCFQILPLPARTPTLIPIAIGREEVKRQR
jgi:hypothetical protein